jgi:L-fucose isomerase-like protein
VTAAFRARTGVELEVVERERVEGFPLRAALLLTGGTEQKLLELFQDTSAPVLVLTHGAHNSLAAGLETVARLKACGRKARLIHLGDEEARDELPALAQAAELASSLRGKRVGLIGGPSPWLVASSPAPGLLKEKLGVEVLSLELDEVLRHFPEDAPPAEGDAEGVGGDERAMGPRVQTALQSLVEEHGLSAVSIACFELLKHGLTACWALSQLSDRGIPAGCEGDLPALLALMIAQALTGGPGFLANPAEIEMKREKLLLAHCTVPLSLVESYRLSPHFESGMGLAVEGVLKPGPYTLVRFGGQALERAYVVEGAVLPEQPRREDLCRTQVFFKAPKGRRSTVTATCQGVPARKYAVFFPSDVGHGRVYVVHGLR